MVSFVTLTAASVFGFGVAMKGSLAAATLGAFAYVLAATALEYGVLVLPWE